MRWRLRDVIANDAGAAIGMLSASNVQMRLRQIACHPYLIAEPADVAWGSTDERIVSSCGKLAVLDKMLMSLRAAGHKVLIFSQFVSVLNLLADYLSLRPALGDYRMLTGTTPGEERDAAVRDFNADGQRNDIFVFLLSTRAGGLGINLAAADTVIFYDSDWNPKVREPVLARPHRHTSSAPNNAPPLLCLFTTGDSRLMTKRWTVRTGSARRDPLSCTAS